MPKESANPGQLFWAFGPHLQGVQLNLSLALAASVHVSTNRPIVTLGITSSLIA